MGKTDPTLIKKIAIGTVQFGLDYGISNVSGKTTAFEINRVLNFATQEGIQFIDTAYSYGSSEKTLGDFTSERSLKIISKFPRPEHNRNVRSYLEESLSLLKVKQLYGYLAHDAESIINDKDLWRQMQELRDSGIVSNIGYSLYSPIQLEKLLAEKFIPDIVQLPYNLFDRRFEPAFVRLKSIGVQIHVRSAFLQGLFFVKPEELPSYFDPAKPLIRKLQQAHPSNDLLAASCLRFCLTNEFVDLVVIGINNMSQLSSNLDGLSAALPTIEFDDFILNEDSILLPYLWPKISQ